MLLLFNLNDPTHRFVVLESTNNRVFDVFLEGGGFEAGPVRPSV
jgi:hypothetical protein